MKQLERRIKRLEKKLNSKDKNGIPEWALKVAEDKRWGDNFSYKSGLVLNEVKREQFGENPEDPEPPELQTEDDVLAFAKQISEKYDSLEDYRASLPPMDFTAVRKVMDSIDRENRGKKEIWRR